MKKKAKEIMKCVRKYQRIIVHDRPEPERDEILVQVFLHYNAYLKDVRLYSDESLKPRTLAKLLSSLPKMERLKLTNCSKKLKPIKVPQLRHLELNNSELHILDGLTSASLKTISLTGPSKGPIEKLVDFLQTQPGLTSMTTVAFDLSLWRSPAMKTLPFKLQKLEMRSRSHFEAVNFTEVITDNIKGFMMLHKDTLTDLSIPPLSEPIVCWILSIFLKLVKLSVSAHFIPMNFANYAFPSLPSLKELRFSMMTPQDELNWRMLIPRYSNVEKLMVDNTHSNGVTVDFIQYIAQHMPKIYSLHVIRWSRHSAAAVRFPLLREFQVSCIVRNVRAWREFIENHPNIQHLTFNVSDRRIDEKTTELITSLKDLNYLYFQCHFDSAKAMYETVLADCPKLRTLIIRAIDISLSEQSQGISHVRKKDYRFQLPIDKNHFDRASRPFGVTFDPNEASNSPVFIEV